MIICVTIAWRRQQRYDHRLRNLGRATGDVTVATNLGVPRSTARGWLGKPAKVVVSLDVTNVKTADLQQEVLELRRRVKKLTVTIQDGRQPVRVYSESVFGFLFRTELSEGGDRFRMTSRKTWPPLHGILLPCEASCRHIQGR
jgi:hypothetical protein